MLSVTLTALQWESSAATGRANAVKQTSFAICHLPLKPSQEKSKYSGDLRRFCVFQLLLYSC